MTTRNIGRRCFLASFAAVLALPAIAPAAEVTAIRFGQLVNGPGDVVRDAVVTVDGDRIVKVGSGDAAVPAGARVMDLRPLTGIPGLIDAHTHMTFYWDRKPGTRPWSQLGTLSPAVTAYLAQENARKTLETGVTTVRDLGSWQYLDLAMRDLINRGAMAGPRMLVAGYGLFITSAGSKPGRALEPGEANGVAEVQRVAREQIGAGADWIKMYGSTGSDQDVTGFQTFSFEEMKAAADVAHRAGKRIAIHSYGGEGARDAVRAGADSVEHATDMDDATILEMARRGTVYVPTVDHNRYYIAHKDEYGYDQAVADRLNDYIKRNFETLKRAVKAGMTPGEALKAATSNGAALLGMSKELGAIKPGSYADIVAIEGDPLKDIGSVINGVRWVMKGGAVVVDRRARP